MSENQSTVGSAPSPVTAIACSHCKLPVPPGLVEPGASTQFCCTGCRTAFEIIHSCGLDRYYELRERLETESERTPARGTSAKFAEFDDPSFRSLYCRPVQQSGGAQVLVTELFLEGVHCSACVWLVERLPRVCPG